MRRRPVAFLLAAALTAVFLCPGQASASARGDWWRSRALTAINKFAALDDGSDIAMTYAEAAGAEALLYGWTNPAARAYLAKMYTYRNPDGGWGLNKAQDAFGDGTVNPATTTYTVTIAAHVGTPLLSAYQAGVVPRADVQRIVDLLMSAPHVPVSHGVCVAYSMDPDDALPGYCVHNVNAGVGRALQDFASAGFGANGMHKLISEITMHEVFAYNDMSAAWPYLGDAGPDQDVDHGAYQASSMLRLAYWVGRESAYNIMTHATFGEATAPLAHMTLTAQPKGVAAVAADGVTSMWCVLGDRWHGETDAYIDATTEANRAAQVAHIAAYAARVCP